MLKRAYCNLTGKSLQGWITNLLVIPDYRGRGLSKLLVAACEGLALQWRCNSMHVHCDADETGGRVPQRLYERMNYRTLRTNEHHDDDQLSWMNGAMTSNSVFVVEGVPLLYLRKDLLAQSEEGNA